MPLYVCKLGGTNWRKINRCEEEQTDMLLSEVGVMGIEGGRYVKSHTHTAPFSFQKGADGLLPAPDPLILLRGTRANETVAKTANKELRDKQ